jgi:hypothetical protein
MSARRFSDVKERADRRIKASDGDIIEAVENMLSIDPGTSASVKQLIARRRGWRRVASGNSK